MNPPAEIDKKTRANELARWISIVGHPFALVTLLVTNYSLRRLDWLKSLELVLIVCGVMLLPIFFFMRRQVAKGRWDHVDASNADERPALYNLGLALAVILCVLLLAIPEASGLQHGVAAVAILLLIGKLANRWLKVSLHLAFAVFVAVVIWRPNPWLGASVAAFLPVLWWSRLYLGRHRMSELIGGALIGLLVAGALVWI